MKTACVLFLSIGAPCASIFAENPLLVLIFVFAVLFIIKHFVWKIESKKQSGYASGKYTLKDSILTKTELKFYHVLVGVVPNDL